MSDNANPPAAIPAGWYPDPAGSPAKRWWDGARWTDELQSGEPQPMSTFGGAAPLARTADAYVPLQNGRAFEPATLQTGIAYTRAGWWITTQPLWGLVSQAVIVGTLDVVHPPLLPMVLGVTALNVVFLGILVALAFADRRALLAGGNRSAASPWWILLTPLAYLIARAREVRRWEVGAWAPVLWWSVAMVLSPGLAALGVFAAVGLVVL